MINFGICTQSAWSIRESNDFRIGVNSVDDTGSGATATVLMSCCSQDYYSGRGDLPSGSKGGGPSSPSVFKEQVVQRL